MKHWIQDPETHELIPADEYVAPSDRVHIIGDIEPFMSVDGTFIRGRSHWREHLKATNSVEMGRSDIAKAQEAWKKRKEAQQARTQGETGRPDARVMDSPVVSSRLQTEILNRLHGRVLPGRKELIKLTLDVAKRMK